MGREVNPELDETTDAGALTSDAPDAELEPGTMVDHFKVQRLLGSGAMGRVYLARDTKLGRRVALKLVQPALLGSHRARESFEREARTTARFNHPNIVAIYAVGEHEGMPYVALEYVEGQTLRDRIEARRLSHGEVVRIGLAIAEALAEAHRHGVLHRDLKPENVVVGHDGRLRVLDFGLAKGLGAMTDAEDLPEIGGGLLESGGIKGTPQYMAPEQWRGEPTSPVTDSWAIGCVLFELLADQCPFEASGLGDLYAVVTGPTPAPRVDELTEVPQGLADLIAACLCKDPVGRPESAQIRERLQGLLPGRGRRLAEDTSPYRGLLPFTERHASLFFGREREIDAFVERSRLAPVLPVVGPSGAGKSSFVRAGVVPRLREQEDWVVVTVRPGVRPFASLASGLLARNARRAGRTGRAGSSGDLSISMSGSIPPPALNASAAETLARSLEEEPGRLALELRALAEKHDSRVLLYVDQLEELFTMCPDHVVQRRFLDSVFAAADDVHDPVRVALTVRDDFLGHLATSAAVRLALRHVTVLERPSIDALVRMLVEPAEAAGFAFEDAEMPGEMARSVADELGALPLLSFAADELWKQRDRERKLLLRSAYEKIGGVEGAIATHADGVLSSLASDDVPLARDLLLRMVTTDRTRRTVTRREAVDGLSPAAEQVLDRLVDARLVAVRKARDDADGHRQLELAHESLVIRWPTLSRWIDEGREELAFVAEATHAAARWDKRGRAPDALWHGEELRDALRLDSRFSGVLPRLAEAFMAAAKHRQTRQVRRKRVVLAGALSVLTVASIILAVLSGRLATEKRRAEGQRNEAMLEDARSTVQRGGVLEGRAKLRAVFEQRDSTGARGLYWQLSRNPLLWRKSFNVASRAVGISPSGELVAAGFDDGSVHLIDVASGVVEVLRGHDQKVNRLDFSPAGALATGDQEGRVLVWSPDTHRIVQEIEGGSGLVALRFLPDGDGLLTGTRDGVVRLWDPTTGREVRVPYEGDDAIRSIDVSPDGRYLAVGTDADQIEIVVLEGSGNGNTLRPGHGAADVVRFSPAGRALAISSRDGLVELYDTASWELTGTLEGHTNEVTDVQFSPDGDVIASSSFDRTVKLWDRSTLRAMGTFEGHDSYVYSLSFASSGETIASASYDKSVQLWRVDRIDDQPYERGHTDRATSVAFAPDGRTVVSSGADHTVRTWSVNDGRQVLTFRGHGAEVWGVSVSPDGEWIASGGSDQSVRLWNARSGVLARVLGGHVGDVDDVQFSPDGQLVASAGSDEIIRIWDLHGGASGRILSGHTGSVFRIAFDREGKRLVSGGTDFTVGIWDVASGQRVGTLDDHHHRVRDVRFTRDGRVLSGGDDGRALLRGATSAEPATFEHPRPVQTVDAQPDGDLIVTGSADGVLRLWESSGDLIRTMHGHTGLVYRARFSPDGTRVASVGDDGTVRLWDVATGRPFWHAPVLLVDPARLLTRAGWFLFGETGADEIPKLEDDLSATLADRTQYATSSGDVLCLRTHDDEVELWSLSTGSREGRSDRAELRAVRATEGGCLVLTDGRVERMAPGGDLQTLQFEGIAVALGDGAEMLIATENELITFDWDRAISQRAPVDVGVTALARLDRSSFVVGYRDGSIEVMDVEEPAEARVSSFERHPASPPTRIVIGPRDTVLVGFENGVVGMWDVTDGRHLGYGRLHGPVVHAALEGDSFFAGTELGDALRWDVSALSGDYCQILRELWSETRVVWRAGRIVREAPPAAHRCR